VLIKLSGGVHLDAYRSQHDGKMVRTWSILGGDRESATRPTCRSSTRRLPRTPASIGAKRRPTTATGPNAHIGRSARTRRGPPAEAAGPHLYAQGGSVDDDRPIHPRMDLAGCSDRVPGLAFANRTAQLWSTPVTGMSRGIRLHASATSPEIRDGLGPTSRPLLPVPAARTRSRPPDARMAGEVLWAGRRVDGRDPPACPCLCPLAEDERVGVEGRLGMSTVCGSLPPAVARRPRHPDGS